MTIYPRIVQILFLLFSVCMLCSCSLLDPVSTTPINTYLLSLQSNVIFYSNTLNSHSIILVSTPTAPSWLDSNNMVYQLHPLQLNNFSKNQWADTPAHMLQPMLVQALMQSNHYQAVVPAPFVGLYDQRLDLNILDFEQDFTKNPSCFRLRVQAQLINAETQRVINSTVINVVIPAPANSPAGGVIAANQAIEQLLQKLVRFSVNS